MAAAAVTLALFVQLTSQIYAVPGPGVLSERIVFPQHVESRADTGEQVVRITDDMVLNLEKTSLYGDHVTVVGFDEHNNEVSLSMPGREADKDLYHDSKQLAAVHLTHDEDFQVEGVLGPRFRIRPLPAAERSSEGHVAHLLFEVEEKRGHDPMQSSLRKQLQSKDISGSNTRFHAKNIIPEERRRQETVIYPEITIFCDAPFSEHFRHVYGKILRYMSVFMTSVNLRYLSLVDPYVWIRPVYVVALNKDNEIYLDLAGSDRVYDSKTLDNMPKLLSDYYYFTATDISITVTARDIISTYNGDSYTAGYAYAGTACTDLKAAISEDTPGTFDGIWIFSHELAHVLGAQHDGEGPITNIDGHPGAYQCSWYDGNIMSYIDDKPENHNRFSYCSQLQIRYTAHYKGRECLLEINVKDTVHISYKLPADVLKMENFCKWIKKATKGELIYDPKRVNRNQKCKVYCKEQHRDYWWIFDSPDGFGCGNTNVCYLGRCTRRPDVRDIYQRHAYRLDVQAKYEQEKVADT